MRLRQLARKLDVDTEKVIHYLETIGLPCGDESNAKLSDEQEELLIKKFGPLVEEDITKKIEAVAPAITQEVEKEEQEVDPVQEEPAMEIPEPVLTSAPESSLSEEINIEPEVIRAPKVELTGLKVVGKIELRTPRKKEEPDEEAVTAEKIEESNTKKVKFSNGRNKQRNKPRAKTLSIAEQRNREEKIQQRKKKEAEALAKRKRRANYLKKVKAKEKIEAKNAKAKVIGNKPQTNKSTENSGIFKKFFNWIRRE